nr:helix-turn-helix domain-containing protein [Clostridia bacterium]
MTDERDDIVKKTGARVRYVRSLLDMTQTEVAEMTGLTKTCVSRMEGGKAVTAASLLKLLVFYSEYVRIDVMLSDDMWEAAVTEGDIMIKDKAVSSVLEAKLAATEKGILKAIQKTRNDMARALKALENKTKRSMISARSLTK